MPAMKGAWTNAADALLAVVLSPQCAACAIPLPHPTRGPVCETCWAEVRCAPPAVSTTTTGVIDQWRATGRYAGALRAIIHAFKYEGRRTLAARLGAMMCASGHDVLCDAHCVVPVPLHPWRRLTRGFNQAEDLAAHLERPILRALKRSRATAPQTGLTASARHHNVRGAFTLSWRLSRHTRRTMLEDRTVVLIDDVRTTGATLEACAHVLKEAGAREVRALTLALAE
jgi:ComF family protein